LTNTPARISEPAATICAAGTASPSAQGQVMMSTAAAMSSAWCHPAPSSIQTMNEATASV
jgi:hypothetical protein